MYGSSNTIGYVPKVKSNSGAGDGTTTNGRACAPYFAIQMDPTRNASDTVFLTLHKPIVWFASSTNTQITIPSQTLGGVYVGARFLGTWLDEITISGTTYVQLDYSGSYVSLFVVKG
jgi:hypothetical protein